MMCLKHSTTIEFTKMALFFDQKPILIVREGGNDAMRETPTVTFLSIDLKLVDFHSEHLDRCFCSANTYVHG